MRLIMPYTRPDGRGVYHNGHVVFEVMRLAAGRFVPTRSTTGAGDFHVDGTIDCQSNLTYRHFRLA